MIELLKIRQSNGVNVMADLIADTKDEVTDSNMTIGGLTSNAVLIIGSTVLTADGHYAIRNSSGEWVWQDEEEETAQTSSVSPSVSPQTFSFGRNVLNNSIDIEDPSEIDEPYEESEELTKR